jgi:radical SAM protein with 4Fe4S-binding SPASM domain
MTIFPLDADICRDEIIFPSDASEEVIASSDFISSFKESTKLFLEYPLIKAPSSQEKKLQSIVIPITKSCNLRCPYCFANSNKEIDRTKDFSIEDDEILISAIASNTEENDRVNIIFFGGEPMMRFDIMERLTLKIREAFPDRTLGFSITTNGTLINDRHCEFLSENKFAVLLSLDGYENEHNHRKFKNGKHSFPTVMRNLELLKKFDVHIEIRATLTSDNPYIEETFKYFEELKIPYTIAFAYESENEEGADYVTFSKDTRSAIIQSFKRLETYYTNKIMNNDVIYDSVLSTLTGKINQRVHQECVCAGGYTYFTMMHDGILFSCPHLMDKEEFSLGNINDFMLLNKQSPYTAVSINKIEGCAECWAKHLCMGGCPSQKISTGRSNHQSLSPARCELEKIIFEHYLRLYCIIKTVSSSINI